MPTLADKAVGAAVGAVLAVAAVGAGVVTLVPGSMAVQCEALQIADDGTLAHTTVELVGDIEAATAADSTIVRRIACTPPYAKTNLLGKSVSSKALPALMEASPLPAPTALGCACADQRPGAAACLALTTAPGPEPTGSWAPAPPALTLEAGKWQGDGCLPKACFELGELRSARGVGYDMPAACLPGAVAEASADQREAPLAVPVELP